MPAAMNGDGGDAEAVGAAEEKRNNPGTSAEGKIPAPGHDGDLGTEKDKERPSSVGLATSSHGGDLEEAKSEEMGASAESRGTPGHGDGQEEEEQADGPGASASWCRFI